jgi:deoxyribose-phosphate aldolase
LSFDNAGLLTKEEKIKACELAKEAGIDYIKTSTGFEAIYPSVEETESLLKAAGGLGVKVVSGVPAPKPSIDTLEECLTHIEAGATRFGPFNGPRLMEAYDKCYSIFRDLFEKDP